MYQFRITISVRIAATIGIGKTIAKILEARMKFLSFDVATFVFGFRVLCQRPIALYGQSLQRADRVMRQYQKRKSSDCTL